MARWEHKYCGTIYEGKTPPLDCDLCVGLPIRVVKHTEQGWRYVGPGGESRPPTRSQRKKAMRSRRRSADRYRPNRRNKIRKTKRQRIHKRDHWTCVECGRYLKDEPKLLTLDHKIPVSKGGTDADDNLQTMCRPCNHTKADT